jgi:hypothetical protein
LTACSQALLEGDAGPRPGPTVSVDAPVFPDGVTLPPLAVDYVDPNHGPFTGGTQVVMRGRGFAAGMAVTFGGHAVAADDLMVLDAHRAIMKTPPGAAGPADIGVVAAGNQTTRQGAFSYDAVDIEPTVGSIAGGTFITIRGLGTGFQDGVKVTFGAAAMTGVQVVNAQELTGYTPPGDPGAVTVTIQNGSAAPIQVANGFAYEATVNAAEGGFAGGPIAGTLNMTILDDYTGNGVPMAYVVVGDPATAQFHGFTDPFGQITFSGPDLQGPLTVTAAHPKYETGAFVGFDAQNATMFIEPLPPDPTTMPPDPTPTGPPPSRPPSSVSGDIVFGGTTSIGNDGGWALVPEPDQPGEIKRTYVFPTGRDIFYGSDTIGGAVVDFVAGQEAWHYQLPVGPSAFALVAVAGIYNPNIDPDGPGPLPKGVFVPYAMGVMRNLVVGIGENMTNVTIPIDIPLDTAILVQLTDAPAIGVAGTDGPTEYRVSAVIDLGGEGVIRLPGSRVTFADKPSAILGSLAPIGGVIGDASYSIVAGAYTAGRSEPISLRVVRGVRDLSRPVAISGFLGTPRAVDPPEKGTSATHHLVIGADGGTGTPTFTYHVVIQDNGTPVFRALARGDLTEVPIYDVTVAGLPALTTKPLIWTVNAIEVSDRSFDTFTYGLLNANTWNAYASDSFDVAFP